MSTSLIAKPINTMMQKAVAQKMQSRLGDDQEDAVKISEIPAMYASKVRDIPSNIGTQVRNIPQNFNRSVDERVNAVRNLTPQNVGKFVMNQAQKKITDIANPVQTFQRKFAESVSSPNPGKYNPLNQIKATMPEAMVREGMPKSNAEMMRNFTNTVNPSMPEAPKDINRNNDDELLEFLKELDLKRS